MKLKKMFREDFSKRAYGNTFFLGGGWRMPVLVKYCACDFFLNVHLCKTTLDVHVSP